MENQRVGGESLMSPSTLNYSPDLSAAGAKTDRKDTGESSKQNKDGLKVCQFFQKGKCHFGGRCRLSHSDPASHDSAVLSPDMDDKQDEEKMDKHKKKKGAVSKAVKPKDNEGKDVNKKPRMRTADEVISRILWDTSVDASEFVVGYVDRFLGVLERPFCDFNWDTNPCDCDYTTELALPRHRIQYFAYRGHRVWDRHSRTDRVFGSTGQSLAPPFGKEEEVKDGSRVKDPEQQQDRGCETTEEQTGAVGGRDEDCAHTKNRHVEDEELNEMNHTFAPTQCGGNTSQEQQDSHGLCVEEEAANRLQSPTEKNSSFQENDQDVSEEGEEKHFEDWEETLEGHEDTQDPAPEQAEEKCDGRPPKKKPTHFITFRANTPTILSCFHQLQEELTALLPSSAPHWQAAPKLHVTLCLLVLRGPAEVAAAAEILCRFAQLDRNPPVAVTFPVKLKHFSGRVLYLSPQPQLRLHQLNCGLQEAFRKEGWLHRSSYNPRYHLTLAKMHTHIYTIHKLSECVSMRPASLLFAPFACIISPPPLPFSDTEKPTPPPPPSPLSSLCPLFSSERQTLLVDAVHLHVFSALFLLHSLRGHLSERALITSVTSLHVLRRLPVTKSVLMLSCSLHWKLPSPTNPLHAALPLSVHC